MTLSKEPRKSAMQHPISRHGKQSVNATNPAASDKAERLA